MKMLWSFVVPNFLFIVTTCWNEKKLQIFQDKLPKSFVGAENEKSNRVLGLLLLLFWIFKLLRAFGCARFLGLDYVCYSRTCTRKCLLLTSHVCTCTHLCSNWKCGFKLWFQFEVVVWTHIFSCITNLCKYTCRCITNVCSGVLYVISFSQFVYI